MSPTRLDAFVLQNHSFMTIPNIAEETGENVIHVRASFKRLGLTPIAGKVAGYNQFVLDWHQKMTFEQMRAKIGITADYLDELANGLGLNRSSFKKPAEGGGINTPRQVFANYQVAGANHYHPNDQPDIAEEIENSLRQNDQL